MKTLFKSVYLLVALALLAAMTGCASTDYETYAKEQSKVEIARHTTEAEKYKALSGIGASGSDSARVAAVMALAFAGNGQAGAASGGPTLRAPDASNPLLQWASVLVPGLTQAYGIHANMRLGMTQSDNSAGVARSTNDTLGRIAGLIQAPGAVTTTNTDNHSVYTPAPVVVTPPAPVVITPVVPIVPVVVGK